MEVLEGQAADEADAGRVDERAVGSSTTAAPWDGKGEAHRQPAGPVLRGQLGAGGEGAEGGGQGGGERGGAEGHHSFPASSTSRSCASPSGTRFPARYCWNTSRSCSLCGRTLPSGQRSHSLRGSSQ